jgi:hypothetical protein
MPAVGLFVKRELITVNEQPLTGSELVNKSMGELVNSRSCTVYLSVRLLCPCYPSSLLECKPCVRFRFNSEVQRQFAIINNRGNDPCIFLLYNQRTG